MNDERLKDPDAIDYYEEIQNLDRSKQIIPAKLKLGCIKF